MLKEMGIEPIHPFLWGNNAIPASIIPTTQLQKKMVQLKNKI
jgi:hypothetical protein